MSWRSNLCCNETWLMTTTQTAGLSLIDGQGLEIPAAGAKGEQKDEWLVVNGGSGTVGQFFCQIASLCGYKVLASCSPSKNEVRDQAPGD